MLGRRTVCEAARRMHAGASAPARRPSPFGLARAARDDTLGGRLAPARSAPGLSFDFEAMRKQRDTAAPAHTVGAGLRAAW